MGLFFQLVGGLYSDVTRFSRLSLISKNIHVFAYKFISFCLAISYISPESDHSIITNFSQDTRQDRYHCAREYKYTSSIAKYRSPT
jgi:hypothetical protein